MSQPEEFGFSPEEEALERELTRAMRSVDPPDGFAERTLARAAQQQSAPAGVLPMAVARRWVSAALAAMLLGGVFAGEAIHVQRQKQREREARAQFAEAIEITDRTLAHTRQKLVLAGVRLER